MLKKIKKLIRYSTYGSINFFCFPRKEIKPESILLIRLDAIGDYILFRNFIKILAESRKYKGYRITLLGNEAWRELAVELDSRYIHEFIWINPRKFCYNLPYIIKTLKMLSAQAYEIIISPVYSREFFIFECIVKFIVAKEKIGSIGNLHKVDLVLKKHCDKYYTKLCAAETEVIFEFYRNREFFENLLEEKLDIKKPFIKIENDNTDMNLPDKYAVLFIGAAAKFRKWKIENFVQVGEYIKEKYGFDIILCGGPDEKLTAEKFRQLFKYEFVDLVGKTSLFELVRVIEKGKLIITNDTSAQHIAVAEDRHTIVISNGNHFGRFVPYPGQMTDKYHILYPSPIENNLTDYRKHSNAYREDSLLDINEIPVRSVIEKVDGIFNNSEVIGL